MSADRERNNDMTQTDIALLLADAADEVEIGIAPVQAVLRGGRRRRARRWAVAATTALVLAGSTGATLALTGMPGGHGDRGAPVATRPASPEARHVYQPQRTELSRGTDHGKEWMVSIDVWGAPRDKAEAAVQLEAMKEYGLGLGARPNLSGLVGKTSYYVNLYYGNDHPRTMIFDSVDKWDHMAGTDLVSGAVPLAEEDVVGPSRLVVGRIAKSARQVTCAWMNGTTTVARPSSAYTAAGNESVIRSAAGTPVNWFVCVGPDGTGYKDVRVTK